MEARLYDPADPPPWAAFDWYADRERAPHAEQAAHRGRMHAAAMYAAHLLRDYHVQPYSVCDWGAGDGGMLHLVRDQVLQAAGRDAAGQLRAWGYDAQPANVAGAAERGERVALADITTPAPLVLAYGLAQVQLATEVLEHLPNPHAWLAQLRRACRVVGHARLAHLVASSPATETADSHYEHHLWAWDQAGYADLLEGAGWRVWSVTEVDGFQVAVARDREG